MSDLIENPAGGYAFLPGIPAFSEGCTALSGYSVIHARFHRSVPLPAAYRAIEATLSSYDRPIAALCGVELRIPEQLEVEAFRTLNKAYIEQLRDHWELFVDGVNPVPRCNLALTVDPVSMPALHGFSFTVKADRTRPHFVTAGINDAAMIYGSKVFQQVASGEPLERASTAPKVGDASSMVVEQRLRFILAKASARLATLGVSWEDTTQVELYLARPIADLLERVVLPEIGLAGHAGLRWFAGLAPFIGPEAEMDVRGFSNEIILDPPK